MKVILLEILLFFCILYYTETRGYTIISRTKVNKDDKIQSSSSNKFEIYKKCDPCAKGKCVPLIQCPAILRLESNNRPPICDLPGGTHGYCCTTGQNHTMPKNDSHTSRSASDFTLANKMHEKKQINDILSLARSKVAKLIREESTIVRNVKDGPGAFHNMVFRSSEQGNLNAIKASRRAMERVIASRIYKQRAHIPTEDFELNQVDAFLDGSSFQSNCVSHITCPPNPSKYRSENGECNNYNPSRHSWGASGFPMERLLPPSYPDGIWEPRIYSVDGSLLTSPRVISRVLLSDADRPHPSLNLLFMQFGQLITHDVTQSASITTDDAKSINCCSEDGSSMLPHEASHFACMPIDVEPDDEFYTQYNQRCINFVRSSLGEDRECKLGYGKQISKVTHFLDGSAIYGSDSTTYDKVRAYERGLLRMFDDFGREMLPLTNDEKSCGNEIGPCFFTGDGRSNQIISLTVLHQIFSREHNRIALLLEKINPHWPDEKLFQEARAIVIAKLQVIIYREYLPLLIGTEAMERFDLNLRHDGYSDDYDENINACVTSEFSTAAFRFGHSTVDGKLIIRNGPNVDEIIRIPDVMFNSAPLRRRHFYDELLNTLIHQPMQQVDSAITYGLTRFLFRKNNPFGLDLAAINMQRGRDHGIRCYNDYLEATGHKRVTAFEEFGPDMARLLSKVYAHPDDIDLWIGGIMESSKGDALLGPTFTEIIADQFSRFRKGDRYFFEHNPNINPGVFTPGQLEQIRLTSLARIICDNADGYTVTSVPPNAFLQPHVQGNSPVSCRDYITLPVIDYIHWKE